MTATLINEVLYIDNIERFKLDMLNLVQKIKGKYVSEYHKPRVIIEDSSLSISLLQYLERLPVYPLLYRSQGDKVTRANNVSYFIQTCQVKLLQ